MGPLAADHPLISDADHHCPFCKSGFAAGEYVTLWATLPASEEDADKARRGAAYTSEAAVCHWDCVPEEFRDEETATGIRPAART
jgi:hypothetical protein